MLRRIWRGDHALTEWDAADYERISGLQLAMAEEVLALLDLNGARHILDIGCGNGKITAEIAARVPHATVVGVDPSHDMIEFASGHYDRAIYPNLRFEIADARSLPYREEFDLVVSFNALHWIPQQDEALQSIYAAMKSGARPASNGLQRRAQEPGTCARGDMFLVTMGAILRTISQTLSAPDAGGVQRTRQAQWTAGGPRPGRG